MAGPTTESFGNRQLLQIISGAGYLRPQEYVGYELQNNVNKFLHGFLFYKKPRSSPGEAQLKDKKLKKEQLDFVLKLSNLLGLDEVQCHDLFCDYLFTEFRGSKKELAAILSHERNSQVLMLKIVDFYHAERLYLLRCVRILLNHLSNKEHPYKELYTRTLNDLLEKNQLKTMLLAQFDDVCSAPLPNKDTHGPMMSQAMVMNWALQNLKEQVELLELMLLYYKYFQMDLETLLDLSLKFKKRSFGWGQSFKYLVDLQMEKLIQKIGYLEVLILLEGLDIMNAVSLKDMNNLAEHMILCSNDHVARVDEVFNQMQSEPVHGPLQLAWSVLMFVHGDVQRVQDEQTGSDRSSRTFRQARLCGKLALQLGAYEFLLDLLDSEHFSRKSEESATASCIIYSLISSLLAIFQEESLGNLETLFRIAARLLKWDFLADAIWEKGEVEGLAFLYDSAQKWFPLDFEFFIQMNISLAGASQFSARKVKANLHMMSIFSEVKDNTRHYDWQADKDSNVLTLWKNKYFFHGDEFHLPKGTKGVVVAPPAGYSNIIGAHQVIQWKTIYNGWHYFLDEVLELLTQVSKGVGSVQSEQLIKATMILELVKEMVSSDPTCVAEFIEILNLSFQLVSRFAALNPAPPELISNCVQLMALAAPQFHSEISYQLKHTGFLPFLTGSIDSLSKVQSGEAISQGLYGCVLSGTECAQGVYPVTIGVIDLVIQLVQAPGAQERERDLLPSVLFILRDVFPHFHKWRYVNISQRKIIGQKCLQLFHRILNFARLPDKSSPTERSPGLRESCVFSLLFTEAGRSLLEIVSTGLDNIQSALAQQSSLMEGGGVDLLELVEMSLSLLNRLLLLKPPDLGPSPVEQALSSQPSARQHQNLVATVAQYVYHRHSHRLPKLATVLLKRLAVVSPMSILACLGSNAEPIRDLFLTRLQAVSEDVHLRVAILELLAVCVDFQPGLLEIFLSLDHSLGSDPTKSVVELGQRSCLPILLELIQVNKQCTYECPPALLCAALELIHALWYGMREIPMAVLRKKASFWPSVLAPLAEDIPEVQEEDEMSLLLFKLRVKLSSFSLRIVAMEIYAVDSNQPGNNFVKAVQDTFANDRLLYWSKMVKDCMIQVHSSGKQQLVVAHDFAVSEHPPLNLLLAWKNFLITSNKYQAEKLKLTNEKKVQLLDDLLAGIQAQFHRGSDLSQLSIKLASIASALYFTLNKAWASDLLATSSLTTIVDALTNTVKDLTTNEIILPSVHIGLLGSITAILQHFDRAADVVQSVPDLLAVVSSVFLLSAMHLTNLLAGPDGSSNDLPLDAGSSHKSSPYGGYSKLYIVSCCLLGELVHRSSEPITSLQVLQESGIVPCILSTVEAFFKVRQGVPCIYASLMLMVKFADSQIGANMLLASNMTSHLCLALTSCYSEDMLQSKSFSSKTTLGGLSWHSLYCLSLDLFSTMLRVLSHSFLDQAISVVGVHQDRMQQTLSMARNVTSKPALVEAESTCNFLLELSAFHRQWRFYLPDVLDKMTRSLAAMVQTHIGFLTRPMYLQHLLEHPKDQDIWNKLDSTLLLPSFAQQQASLEELDQPSSKLLEVQHSLLRLVAKSLTYFNHFTPPLTEILLDQGVDIIEWPPILTTVFSSPSLDESDSDISFGTLLSCVTVCVQCLIKTDKKMPAHRTASDSNKVQNTRSCVNYLLELSLHILMSQACRYLRDANIALRDRQYLKRELGTELNSCLSPLQRQMRRGVDRSLSTTPPHQIQTSVSTGITSSTAATTTSHFGTLQALTSPVYSTAGPGSLTPQFSHSTSQVSASHDQVYLRLVQGFVQKVLK